MARQRAYHRKTIEPQIMKTIQVEAHKLDNNGLLRSAGVKRIHPGWYTVTYIGATPDPSTVIRATRNRGGRIHD